MSNTSDVRVSVVLPGLVDTPFTWNQARGNVVENGTLVPAPGLSGPIQIWQCVGENGTLVEDGNCPDGGGTGYGCPCPDVARDDPRVPLLIGMLMANTTLIHPNSVAREILALASHLARIRGPCSATSLTAMTGSWHRASCGLLDHHGDRAPRLAPWVNG